MGLLLGAGVTACILVMVLSAVPGPSRSEGQTEKGRVSARASVTEDHHDRRGGISSPAKRLAVTRSLESMPLHFIENRGQLDSRVAYYVQGRDTTLYFTAEGMTLVQAENEQRGDMRSTG